MDKRTRHAFIEACLADTGVAALPLSNLDVLQVSTERAPPEREVWWRVSPPRASTVYGNKAPDFTNIQCVGKQAHHYLLEVLINGKRVKAVYDCGASTSIISIGLCKIIGEPVGPAP